MTIQADAIKSYILNNISRHPENIVAIAAQEFNVTRTTIHRHLNTLIQKKLILKSGTTRNIKYIARSSLNRQLTYQIQSNLSEFNVLQNDFSDIFKEFSENIKDICIYGFTEIFNNAIDHSNGSNIKVTTRFENERLSITIHDNGVGIFNKLADHFKLTNFRESVLHLTKGKVTTDPMNHTGEGIFFTSRAFDFFEIYANHLHYYRNNQEDDWALGTEETNTPGSCIKMSIGKNASQQLIECFKQYQDPNSLAFNRTEILVELSRFGDEPFISRSQAKRVIIGLEKFQHITLDFAGVRLVGQGFVDELFRVFKNLHPQITLDYIHANEDVTFMIKRGLAT